MWADQFAGGAGRTLHAAGRGRSEADDRALAADHPAVLLENDGPVVAGASLDAAVFAIEELEEAAKLAIILRGMKVRQLSPEAIADLNKNFEVK